MHDRLAIVSAERIRDELDKLMVVPVPVDRACGSWCDTGLADEFLPELPGLALEQDPIHRHKDVLAHTLAVVDKTAPDRLLRLAALFHDVGKPRTRAFGRRRGDLPPPRGGRGPDDPEADAGAALPERRDRHW